MMRASRLIANRTQLLVVLLTLMGGLQLLGCKSNTSSDPAGGNSGLGNDLDNMETARVSIAGHQFQVWVARSREERDKGLMYVEQDQLAPLEDGTERGMLFVFENERLLGFWMKNTIIPLDIAYAQSAGDIVRIYTMTPLDTSLYPSGDRAQFALEVSGGVFEKLGISEGQILEVPDSLLTP